MFRMSRDGSFTYEMTFYLRWKRGDEEGNSRGVSPLEFGERCKFGEILSRGPGRPDSL